MNSHWCGCRSSLACCRRVRPGPVQVRRAIPKAAFRLRVSRSAGRIRRGTWARRAEPFCSDEPVGTREADLSTAVRAGALVDAEGKAPVGDILAAQLVEQVFRDPRSLGNPGPLDTTPYWLGAAVTVSKRVALLPRRRALQAAVVVADRLAKAVAARHGGGAAWSVETARGHPRNAGQRFAARCSFSGELGLRQDEWTGPIPMMLGRASESQRDTLSAWPESSTASTVCRRPHARIGRDLLYGGDPAAADVERSARDHARFAARRPTSPKGPADMRYRPAPGRNDG